jgi:phosphomevalonate kinase
VTVAKAPGKIVLSGAYAVLEGAPAVITAVDRFVTADTGKPAELITPEVKAALNGRTAPSFDASTLRENGQKLGLGSSAAILVASLGALAALEKPDIDEAELRQKVLGPALTAHRAAQGGGSGIDVATSVHGGTIIAAKSGKSGDGLNVRQVGLPDGLFIRVLFAGAPASTSELLGKVRAFKARSPHEYDGVLLDLKAAAEDAERAFDESDARGVVRALRAQLRGLTDLGELARASIVTREVARLNELADEEDAVVLPAGAGGGDVAICVSTTAASARLIAAFDAQRYLRAEVALNARGLHLPTA